MKTKLAIEQNIINITTKIHSEFPELVKYIIEMPQNNSENGEVNIKNLEDYCDSLKQIVDKYAETHSKSIPKKL